MRSGMGKNINVNNMKKNEFNDEIKDIFFGNNQVELTDDLIEKLVNEKKWRDKESLIEMREMGAKWSLKRNTLIFPIELL